MCVECNGEKSVNFVFLLLVTVDEIFWTANRKDLLNGDNIILNYWSSTPKHPVNLMLRNKGLVTKHPYRGLSLDKKCLNMKYWNSRGHSGVNFEMNALMLRVYLYMYLVKLRIGRIHYDKLFIDIGHISRDSTTIGTLILSDFLLTGLETMEDNINLITVEEEDKYGNNYVCLNNTLEYLNISANYVADIGIKNIIPFYGEGKFLFPITAVIIKMCTSLQADIRNISNLDLKWIYRHQPLQLTGFMKNEDANNIFSKILNAANKLYAMLGNYDPKTTSCLISPFIEYIINALSGQYNNNLDSDGSMKMNCNHYTGAYVNESKFYKIFISELMKHEIGGSDIEKEVVREIFNRMKMW